VAEKTEIESEWAGGVGTFGDLRVDGFRVTRWDRAGTGAGCHVFDDRSLLICLNLAGQATAQSAGRTCGIESGQVGFAHFADARPTLERIGGTLHQFVVFELRGSWVAKWLLGGTARQHPV
jgi:mannose-6-phosphate isomerase class I